MRECVIDPATAHTMHPQKGDLANSDRDATIVDIINPSVVTSRGRVGCVTTFDSNCLHTATQIGALNIVIR